MSGTLSSTWLLRTSGPIYLRSDDAPTLPPLGCACRTPRDRLIVADHDHIELICRCGHRRTLSHTPLADLLTLVEAEPVDPGWQTLDDALHALGYSTAPALPRVRTLTRVRTTRVR